MDIDRLRRWLVIANIGAWAIVLPFIGAYPIEQKIVALRGSVSRSKPETYLIVPLIHTAEATTTVSAQTRAKTVATKKTMMQVKKPSTRTVLRAPSEKVMDVLDAIAQCESNRNPLAKNPRSSAKGMLQIIDGTWRHFQCDGNVYNKEDNIRCGHKIATQSGLHHWNESKTCWYKSYSEITQQ